MNYVDNNNNNNSSKDIKSFIDTDIVICTPGKFISYMYLNKSFRTSMNTLEFFVVDEIDKMMQIDPSNDWLYVFNHFTNKFTTTLSSLSTFLPPGIDDKTQKKNHIITIPLQRLFFTATFTNDPALLGRLQLYKPIYFTIEKTCLYDYNTIYSTITLPKNLKHKYIVLPLNYRPLGLLLVCMRSCINCKFNIVFI